MYYAFSRVIFIFIFSLSLTSTIRAVNYISVGSGNWSGSATTWGTGTNCSAPATPMTANPSNGDNVHICNGHTVIINNNVSIDQATINSGGTLDLRTGAALNINNAFIIDGGTFSSAANLTFEGQRFANISGQASFSANSITTINVESNILFEGSWTFNRLSILHNRANTYNISFQAGHTITVNQQFTARSVTSSLILVSSNPGEAWRIQLLESANVVLENLLICDSDARSSHPSLLPLVITASTFTVTPNTSCTSDNTGWFILTNAITISILSATLNDNDQDNVYSNGDTITITFNQPTNEANHNQTVTKAQPAQYIKFSWANIPRKMDRDRNNIDDYNPKY